MNEPLIGKHIACILGNNSPFFRTLDESKNRKDYFFCDEFNKTWIFFLRKLILNRIHAQFQDLETPIIIKEPNGSIGGDIISKALPNSKIIIMLRDSRDIIHSDFALNSKDGFTTKTGRILKPIQEKNRLNQIKQRSKIWNSLIEILLNTFKNHSSDLRYMIKYEELRTNTFSELKKLYQFIDITFSDDILYKIIEKYTFENLSIESRGIGTEKQFAKIGIWKENFTSLEISTLNEIMGNKLVSLGYEI